MELSPRDEALPYAIKLEELVATCGRAIEEAPANFGCVEFSGVVVQTEAGLRLDTPYADYETAATAVELTSYCVSYCTTPERGAPSLLSTEPADAYRFDDSVTHIPGNSYIAVQNVYKDATNEPVVTVTTAYLDGTDAQESLYACILSKDGQVAHAEIIALPVAAKDIQVRCREILGDDSVAYGLLQGEFKDEPELDEALDNIKNSQLSDDAEQMSALDELLSGIYRFGLTLKADRANNWGLRWRRIQRLLQTARPLAGPPV
jgi:hypothetical protein